MSCATQHPSAILLHRSPACACFELKSLASSADVEELQTAYSVCDIGAVTAEVHDCDVHLIVAAPASRIE